MPLYEYFCPTCQRVFETLRPAQEADAPVSCPSCQHASSQRILSLFANSVKTNGEASSEAMGALAMGGGCCGGACGCQH
jgi:putative FmdB family regulatory protein